MPLSELVENGPLQSCYCFSFLTSSKRWYLFMAIIATSLHISVAYHTLYQYILQQQYVTGLISLGTKESSSEQQGHTVVDAATRSQHTWCRPTYDMAAQGAATEYLNTLHHFNSFRTAHCFGLPMLGREDWRRGNLQKMRNGAC